MNKLISNTHPTLWKESQKEEYRPTKELREHYDFYTYLFSIQKLIKENTIDKAVLKTVMNDAYDLLAPCNCDEFKAHLENVLGLEEK